MSARIFVIILNLKSTIAITCGSTLAYRVRVKILSIYHHLHFYHLKR